MQWVGDRSVFALNKIFNLNHFCVVKNRKVLDLVQYVAGTVCATVRTTSTRSVLGALIFFLEPVQGMSVFLLTTNMRLFLNPIINHIFSPIF